jgi:heme-degrading monooxygenase HmoA
VPVLLIRQRVFDYEAWKQVFDQQAHARTANGCLGAHIFRNPDDPNETVVILTWDSLVRARLFAQSDDLHESLNGGSSPNRPDIWLLEEAHDP